MKSCRMCFGVGQMAQGWWMAGRWVWSAGLGHEVRFTASVGGGFSSLSKAKQGIYFCKSG